MQRYLSKSHYLQIQIHILKQIQNMSGNRNMAEYANFQGKSKTRVNQAPGGSSSFSLAWSNEPTDYGPDRNNRKQSREKNVDYQQPIKLMEEPKSYGSRNMIPTHQNYQAKLGGEHGYGNYNNSPLVQPVGYGQDQRQGYGQHDPRQGHGGYGSYRAPVQQLQIAVSEQQKMFGRPPSVPRNDPPMQGKSSIRLNGPPQENNIFGNNEYNYWKDDGTRNQKGSQKKIINQGYSQGYNQAPIQGTLHGTDKTSVKVHNPPGGKQTFSFG